MKRLTAGGPHYYTLRTGSSVGGERYERELLERLPAHGVDLELGLPRDHAAVPAAWRVEVLRHRLGLHWTVAPAVFAPYAVRLLRSGRADLLRGHSVRHTGPALLLARALTRARVPVVLHHHHLFPRWAKLEAAIARRADLVVTVSEHSRDALVAAGVPAARVRVVVEGVARPPATDGRPDAWPAGGLRLLHVGRLEARKRPELAVDTLAQLRREGVEASLVLAGEGAADAVLERARAGGVEAAVRVLGRVEEADKWRLYDSADVLLFGSTLEGFGLVVAEAQSRGLPVVAAVGTATREAMADGVSGHLAAPEPAAFAAAVRDLADDDRRAAFGRAACEHARRFDWDRCAAEVAELYRELVA